MAESASSICRDIFKHELKAGDLSDELADNYDADEIHDAMEDVVSELLSKVESDDRREKIFLLTYRIGLATNNMAMAEFGASNLEDYGYELVGEEDE